MFQALIESSIRKITKTFPWVERLDIVTGPAPPPEGTDLDNDENIDPNDDFKREAFL